MNLASRATSVLFAFALGCATTAAAENSWVLVKGGSWEPGPAVLSQLKAQLESYAKAKARARGRELRNWSEYLFQYQGLEEKRRKYVFVNALCRKEPDSRLDQRLVLVLDGGACFFHLRFDPHEGRYYHFFINSEG